MPEFEEERIKELIRDRKITAISVDTNVFHKSGYGLENRELRSLAQFRRTRIDVVISDVVLREVQDHMVINAVEAMTKFRSALKAISGACGITPEIRSGIESLLVDFRHPELSVRTRLSQFINHVKLKTIGVESVRITEKVLDRYFDIRAPFAKGDKKNEFPDAFALESLSDYALKNNIMMIAVSADRGWVEFAKSSTNIFCVPELRVALGYFQGLPEIISSNLIDRINMGNFESLRLEICSKICKFVENMEFLVNAHSRFLVESSVMDQKIDGNIDFRDMSLVLVERDGDFYIFSGVVLVPVKISCDFRFYLFDVADKENVEFGSGSAEKVEEMQFQIFFEVEQDPSFSSKFDKLDVFCSDYVVDFGLVEPYSDGID